MKKMPWPASIISMLVGTAIISVCLFLLIGISLAGSTADHDAFDKGLRSKISPQCAPIKPAIARSPLSFEVASGSGSNLDAFKESWLKDSPLQTEDIAMKGPAVQEKIPDLSAMNAKLERNIVYNEYQSGSAVDEGIANSMDILINADKRMDRLYDSYPNRDSADGSKLLYGNWPLAVPELKGFLNYMNIEVRDIKVTATNTVPGGSAVATSTILIQPVQQIVCPSEVEEKLK